MKKETKIAVLVSGGVDSSVALAQLVAQGRDVTAFYLKIWLEDELHYLGGSCPWEQDLYYAREICAKLGVPLKVVNFQQEYWQSVVTRVLDALKSGYTPNPDIWCNQLVKFGAFLESKYAADYPFIATGHYAQVVHNDQGSFLYRAPDDVKDQTYFLAGLSQAQLSRCLFPIGHMQKAEVRQAAQDFGLVTAGRKDSQGICFLGKLSFRDFIKHHLGTRTGNFIEYETGKVMGFHDGYWFYTIGQRQGIGLSGGPWYVVTKDIENNHVFISNQYYSTTFDRRRVFLRNVHSWGTGPITKGIYFVKLRHGPKIMRATLSLTQDRPYLMLDENDQGIAPGQYAVLYTQEGMVVATAEIDEKSLLIAPFPKRIY